MVQEEWSFRIRLVMTKGKSSYPLKWWWSSAENWLCSFYGLLKMANVINKCDNQVCWFCCAICLSNIPLGTTCLTLEYVDQLLISQVLTPGSC